MLLIKFSDKVFQVNNKWRQSHNAKWSGSVSNLISVKKKKESSADPNINLLLELSSTDCVQDLQTNGECLSGKYG